MDSIWAFREASAFVPVSSHSLDFCLRYNTATQIKNQQDEYCARVSAEDWVDLGDFPEVLEWEALVDVLRGKVKVPLTNGNCQKAILINFYKVHIHAYEAVDLDALVRVRLVNGCCLASHRSHPFVQAFRRVQIPNCHLSSRYRSISRSQRFKASLWYEDLTHRFCCSTIQNSQ